MIEGAVLFLGVDVMAIGFDVVDRDSPLLSMLLQLKLPELGLVTINVFSHRRCSYLASIFTSDAPGPDLPLVF